ncbi:hypothetical protein [Spartinivicinus ruber]|uniref:hypothetical protein n=1 Tax=Spartinivicinus ruber TaxID=2683272 RepID=UPI0013D34E15|nr:hypothetical protein [Spartinivicinus ruber]
MNKQLLKSHPSEHIQFNPYQVMGHFNTYSRQWQLQILPIDAPCSFEELQVKRNNSLLMTSSSSEINLTVNNLGVSAHLVFQINGVDYLVLVEQKRHDFKDKVLKLISGYVSSEYSYYPKQAIADEITQECLMVYEDQLACWQDHTEQALPDPEYQGLTINKDKTLTLAPDLMATPQQIALGAAQCEPHVTSYLHVPTNSLQLVYHWRTTIRDLNELSCYFVDEIYNQETQRLETTWDKSDKCYFAELQFNQFTGTFFQLEAGQLKAVDLKNPLFSEYFCQRKGIMVFDNHTVL